MGVIKGDWNNDGGPDLWFQFNCNSNSAGGDLLFTYVPITIAQISNGIGVTTTVKYDHINNQSPLNTNFYARGAGPFGCSGPTPSVRPIYSTTLPYVPSCLQDGIGPMWVVAEVDSSDGVDGTPYKSTYTYTGAVDDLWGHGFEGFTTMTITDQRTGIQQITTYKTAFPLTGMIAEQKKKCPGTDSTHCLLGVTLSDTTNGYTLHVLGAPGNGSQRFVVELASSQIVSNDLNGVHLPTVTTTYTYDCDSSPCFGNATVIDVVTSDPNNNNAILGTKITTNTYTNDNGNQDPNYPNDWLLGRLVQANVESIVGTYDATRHTIYCYDLSYVPNGTSCPANTTSAPTGLLTMEEIEPNAIDVTQPLTTNYTYDSFGNKIEADVTGCAVPSGNLHNCTIFQTRTTTTKYDSNGEFVIRDTNPLGESETWVHEPAFGQATSHTGPNGLTTAWQYDTYGRVILETPPDNTQTRSAYTYCTNLPSGETCPSNAVFDVIVCPEINSDLQCPDANVADQNGPMVITFYDALSRVIAKDVQGFQGASTNTWCWSRTDTIYDSKGRVAQTDRPYYLGNRSGCTGGTQYFYVNSYVIPTTTVEDALGRVQQMTPPTLPGNLATGYKLYTYNGLTTAVDTHVTRPNVSGTWTAYDLVTTTVKNGQGLVASVQDPDTHTTQYAYDAFDNLITVTDPKGNV